MYIDLTVIVVLYIVLKHGPNLVKFATILLRVNKFTKHTIHCRAVLVIFFKKTDP